MDLTAYAVDGLTPSGVLLPETPEELAAELRRAADEGLAVAPWGGGTQASFGRPPARLDLVLSTSRLARVLDHAPADLTVTVEAGMSLGALQGFLAPFDQQLAIDAPLPGRATIGGVLATAASGPRRLGYGNPRDQIIGIRVAHPDGRLTRGGGKVVKNVTGYDMMRLYVGSHGTLGVIVEATFKLAPLPAVTRTLAVPCRDLEQFISFARPVRHGPAQPLAFDLLDARAASAVLGREEGLHTLLTEDPQWLAAIEFGGPEAAVERGVREAAAAARAAGAEPEVLEERTSTRLWGAVRDFGRDGGRTLLARVSVLPGSLVNLLTLLEGPAREGPAPPALLARAGSGALYLCWPEPDLAESERWGPTINALRGAASKIGGSLVVEACPASLKPFVDVWGPAPATLPLMRRLKEQFDPLGVLNPGRYVGGL